jgi:2-C-methyl-D-erythritol 4-phosphate cytidylyltransferase
MLRNASQILVAAPAQDRLHILKQPIKIAGKPIIEHTIAAMQHHRAAQIVVT